MPIWGTEDFNIFSDESINQIAITLLRQIHGSTFYYVAFLCVFTVCQGTHLESLIYQERRLLSTGKLAYPVGLEVKTFIWGLIYIHTLCMQAAKNLTYLHFCAVLAWATVHENMFHVLPHCKCCMRGSTNFRQGGGGSRSVWQKKLWRFFFFFFFLLVLSLFYRSQMVNFKEINLF